MSVTVTPDSPLSPQALAELHELEKLSDEQQMDLLTREGKEVKKKRWADLLKTLGGDELKAPELPDDAFEQTRLRLERRRLGERSPERSPTFFADEELDDDVVDWNALGNDDDDDEGLFGELPIQNVDDVRQAVQLSPGQCGMYTKRGNCKDDNDCVWNPKKDPKCQKRQRKKRQRKTKSPKKSSPPRGSPHSHRSSPHRSSSHRSSSSDIIDLTKSSPQTPKSSPPRRSPPRDSPRREFKAHSWGPGSTSPKKRRSSSSVEKKRRSKKRKIKYNIRYLNKEIKRLQKKRAALLLLYESM